MPSRLLLLTLSSLLLSTAGAQPLLIDLQIHAPAPGAIRGIDSLFTVEATVAQIGANADLQIFLWLVHGGADAQPQDVLADATVFDIDKELAPILDLNGTSFIAATQALGPQGTGLPATVPLGDATAIAVAALETDIYRFTWTGRVPASTGTFTGVRAAALARSPQGQSAIKLSPPNHLFTVDGDRPPHYGIAIIDAWLAFEGGLIPQPVTFPRPPFQRLVGGIDDTLRLSIDVEGPLTNTLLLTDELSLALQAFGQHRQVDLTQRRSTLVEFRLPIAAGGAFGNLNPQASGPTDLEVFTVDPAGNLSSVNTGTETDSALDDIHPRGVAFPVDFLIDDGIPILDQPLPSPDFDADGQVSWGDFFLFAQFFGGTAPRFDLDQSGRIDLDDFALFAAAFGRPAAD
ncbi:MAG: hypothetical protein GKR89_26995 [Candidatus Latescibacteria bacterium]|nr:hypothetical protein [Candidatus Latescibacterota bacterium]